MFMDFPGGSDSRESACYAGDPDSISGSGRSPGEENGYPLWYSGLDNSMDYDCKEISPGISLEGLMLKLKLQYFGHLM